MTGLVLAGIRHRLLRSLTGIVATAVAMAVLTLAMAGVRRADRFADQTPDYLVITSINPWQWLSAASAAKLARLPGVEGVEYYDLHNALDGTPEQNSLANLVAASDGYFHLLPRDMIGVSHDMEQQWASDRQAIVASRNVVSKMRWKPGETVTLPWQSAYLGDSRSSQFRFIGECQGELPDVIVAHYDSIDQNLSSEEQGRVAILGVFRAAGAHENVDRAVAELMSGLPEPMRAGPSRQWAVGGMAGEQASTDLLKQLSVVLLFITWAVVGAAIAMSLRERRSEIGTLRALGFSRLRVFCLILGEALVLALSGFVLGVLVPTALTVLLGRGVDLGPFVLADVRPGVTELVLAALGAGALALAISVWPALSASRQDVVATLQEG